MGLLATKGDSKNFEPAPAGTHISRCIRLIDIGTQPNERFGNPKHQVLIFWELPTELDDEDKPFVVQNRYTLSIHEKSNLGKHLASWRGRPFTEEELRGFDLKNIIGKACMITLVHNTKVTTGGTATYANVNAVTGVIKGVEVPAQFHDSVIYDMEDHDQSVYEALPDYIRKMIEQSHERTGTPQEMASSEAPFEQDVPPDDVPF